MKILHVCTYDSGGASISMQRLSKSLNVFVQSKNLFAYDDVIKKIKLKNSDQNIIHRYKKKIYNHFGLENLYLDDWEIEREKKYLQSIRPHGLEMVSLPVSSFDITKSDEYKWADIVNLHWTADFLDWPSFFKKNKKPVVWTLHDTNPFSGIEHYDEPYFGIDVNGLPQKRVKSSNEINESEKWYHIKRELIKKVDNLNIVSPSKWLLELSKSNGLFTDFNHHHIPYSVPEIKFKINDKFEAREKLGLPQDKTIMLFVSFNVESERKGFKYLNEAIKHIDKRDNTSICAVGKSEVNDDNIIYLGKVTDESKMALVYSSADVFIIPSLEDNLPNTMLESLMCGTPVIGFPVGGIKETIRNDFNGILSESIGVWPLVNALNYFLSKPHDFDRYLIASDALSKYASSIQANEYVKLYSDILNR